MKTPFLAALALLSISTAFSADDRRLPRLCAHKAQHEPRHRQANAIRKGF